MSGTAVSRSRTVSALLLSTALAFALSLAGCSALPGSARVRVTGSDTMYELMRSLADAYRSGTGIPVGVRGGGSREGIRALVEGRTDIAASSRPLLPDEARALLARRSSLGMGHLIARDAICVYVHPANPIRTLTLAQLRDLFTGRTRRWSELGGPDAAVRPVIRDAVSGTHLYFEEHVMLGDPYSDAARRFDRTTELLDAVAADSTAVGYGGWGVQREGVRRVAVEGVLPDERSVRDGRYPIARYMVLYTVHHPPAPARAFIDWIMSDAGQRVIAGAGGIPLFEDDDDSERFGDGGCGIGSGGDGARPDTGRDVTGRPGP